MDCRRGLWLALGLWGAAGCQHAAPGIAGNTPAAVTAPAEQVVTRKVADGPKKMPKAETCVQYADYRAGEACASNYSPSQRDLIREDARKAYQQALQVDPKCVGAQQGLARLAAASEDYARALAAYQKALKAAPQNAALWFELGLCCNHMQQWDEALKAISRAAALDPENRTYVNSEAVLLARLGRHQESLECFARVTSEAQAHFNLACTLKRLDLKELSKRQLELALEKNPRLESARAMLDEITASSPGRPAPPAAPSGVQPTSYSQPAESEAGAPAGGESIAGPPETDTNFGPQGRQPEQQPAPPPPDGQ